MRYLLIALLCGMALGCGESQEQIRKLAAAREKLQINRPQEALDLLVNVSSAEGYYLKSIAMYRRNLDDAAREQIHTAVTMKPKVAKYRGFELLLELSKKDPASVDQLIALFNENRSSGAIALFATSAFSVKGEVQQTLDAFDASLTLSADAPEFMFELLKHAINTGRTAAATSLTERIASVAPDDFVLLHELLQMAVLGKLADASQKLLKQLEAVSPSDPEVAKQQVQVLSLVNKKDDAVKAAEAIYEEGTRSEESALIYAYSLFQAEPTPAHEQALKKLVADYPRNLEILAKYAIFLARAKRMPEALEVLHTSIRQQTVKSQRDHLIHAAIALCVAMGDADGADAEIAKYRDELNDPLLVDYFEGRVLYLRKDYDAALVKFRSVVEKQKDATGTQRALAADTLHWVQRIWADQNIKQQLKGVAERVKTEEELKSAAPKSAE